jgi:hypothetical protein
MVKVKVKVKQSNYRPGQALRVTGLDAPRFRDNQYMRVVRLSALKTGPKELFLVLIYFQG